MTLSAKWWFVRGLEFGIVVWLCEGVELPILIISRKVEAYDG